MEIDVVSLLRSNGMLLLFSIIGFGYLLGNLRIAGVEAGPVVGVLLMGLLCGHFGFTAPAGADTFGFALFIFSVGIQAGPTFFSAFRADGVRYMMLAVVVATTAATLAWTLSMLLGLEYGFGAGLLAGALTSTPTLAGAQDAVNSGLATLPSGITAAQARENVSVGYAITYLFGTIGMVVGVRFLPRLIGLDLPAEAARLARERGLGAARRFRGTSASMPIIRAYRVAQEFVGKSLTQLSAERGPNRGRAMKLRRNGQLMDMDPDMVLQEGDVISFIAGIRVHEEAQSAGHQEVLDRDLLNYQIRSREIIVTDQRVVGRTFRDLDLPGQYGCFATGLVRASIELPVDANLPLQKGDRLLISGEEKSLERLAGDLGYLEADVQHTDLATFAFGLIAGTMLGLLMISFGTISVGLGSAGGLLIVGIIIGYLGSVMPTFGRVPAPARLVLMELGLMMFMASVGLNAGGGVVAALTSVGPMMILAGVVVTLVPATTGYLFGRYALRMNPALLLGSITGAMTSTPALNVLNEAARSAVPSLGYAGTYTFANVLLTFAGTLMMVLQP